MNPAYQKVRFRAELPDAGLPVRFGIVTAYNPDGVPADVRQNGEATELFRRELVTQRLFFFPVTGGSPDFVHAEPGFGIALKTLEEAVKWGCRWHQEAVFWVDRGVVTLVPCDDTAPVEMGPWEALAEPPAHQPRFHFLGNPDLLALPKTALFCSARCPGTAILKAHDKATQWREQGRCIISGFHSPVEQECLRILLRGKSAVIICPARAIPRRMPPEWDQAIAEGRLLLLSALPFTETRISNANAVRRNEMVARLATDAWFAHIAPGSQSEKLSQYLRDAGVLYSEPSPD